jgi:S-DNA-T family DNA segregation ATPase FtsK/SpoIIIE
MDGLEAPGHSGRWWWAMPLFFFCWPAAVVLVVVVIGRPLGKWAWAHRTTTAAASVLVLLAWRLGVLETAGLVAGLGLDLGVWYVVHPPSFRRWVLDPARTYRRRLAYKRRWPDLAEGVGLGVTRAKETRQGLVPVTTVPRLERLELGGWCDRLVLLPVLGHDLAVYDKACPALRLHLGATSVRAVAHSNDRVRLDIVRIDPLAQLVRPFPIPATPAGVNLDALPVGLREDGQVFTVRAGGGRHLFIAGETEAGKSSFVWAIVAALAPLVQAGTVRLWGIDPKCQEVTFGRALFYRVATGADGDAMAGLLEEAAEAMQAAAMRNAGITRTHTPTVDDPLDVIIVDEFAFLTAYARDPAFRKRVMAAASTIATQGRTTGYWLIGAAQDPGKEVIPLRNLFPARIALRLREDTNVDMVLGSGARAAGALCDEIPESLRGVGYVHLDGLREPQRVRAAYLDDQAVTDLARLYRPTPAPAAEMPADYWTRPDGPDDDGPGLRSVA